MGIARNVIFWLSSKKTITNAIARRGMKHGFARRFIAGETLQEALTPSRELNRLGRSVSMNHLGENVLTVEEAHKSRDSYVHMSDELVRHGLDGNISIKITQLGLDFDRELCVRLTAEIAAAAQRLGRDIEMDMEGSKYTDVTLDIFEASRRQYPNVALAVQAYLFRSEKDLERLAPLAPKIRLVKGAYREPANIAWQKKIDVDGNYCNLIDKLIAGPFKMAIASHDVNMVNYAKQQFREKNVPRERYEFQMIYGIRRDLQQQLVSEGYPLRVYVPFGTDWCPYFMRRLSERPANCWFVLRSLVAESRG